VNSLFRKFLWWRRRRLKREIDEELSFHLEQSAAENLAAGMTPEAAAREARKRFGNLQGIREDCREARGVVLGESLLQDVRFALRMLWKNPGFTAVATLTLALGIGANTAMFSVVNTVLLSPLPFAHPDRLVMLWETAPNSGPERGAVSYLNYQDWIQQSRGFDAFALIGYFSGALARETGALRVDGAAVSSSFFRLVGVKPALGRGFLVEEDRVGSEHVIILTHAFWLANYGGDPAIVGKQLKLDGDPFTVVGVLPADFRPIEGPLKQARFLTSLASVSSYFPQRGSRVFEAIGRLKPDVSLAQAQAELALIGAQLAKAHAENQDHSVTVAAMQAQTVRDVRATLWVLLAAVATVLLIVCANLGNLLLIKAISREREMGIRAALGASNIRLIRQTLTESLLMAAMGAALGLALSFWILATLRPHISAFIPRAEDLAIDGAVLGYTALVSILAGLLFGSAPAILILRRNLSSVLQAGSGRTTRTGHRTLQDGLVVAQIGLTLSLLVAAGLLGRSFLSVLRTDLGLQPSNILTFTVTLPDRPYATLQHRQAFWREVIQKTRSLPGIRSVGATSSLPFNGAMAVGFDLLDSRPVSPDEMRSARFQVVSPQYFETLGMTLARGRFFDDHDLDQAAGKMVINETMARRFWGDADPLGKHLKLYMSFGEKMEPSAYEIVGITRDNKQDRIEAAAVPQMAVPFTQLSFWNLTFTAKTTSDPKGLVPAVRRLVASLDREASVSDERALEDWIGDSLAQRRFSLVMLASFSALALFLAAIGVYGVMAFAVNARRREIGIRMALGAQAFDVMALVLRKGLMLVGLGGAIGLIGALAASRWLDSMLYQTPAADPATFGGCLLALVAVGLLACWLPARRAAKVHPLESLRIE